MGANVTGVISKRITVTTAATAVALGAAGVTASFVTIKAPATGNTNNIYVGGSDVSSTNGYPLAASTSVTLSTAALGMSGEELSLDKIFLCADTDANFGLIIYDKKIST